MNDADPMWVSLDGARIRQLLTELDDELDVEITGEGIIQFVLVGGAALALGWNFRGTADLDFINDNLPPELRRAIALVAERNGLEPDWMNDAAKIKIPNVRTLPPKYDTLFEGKKILVASPGPEFLLAMKLFTGRTHDFDDCVFLIQQTNLTTLEELLDLIERGYPTLKIPARCQYFAQKVLAEAGLQPL